MKKLFLLLFTTALAIACNAQEFSFQMVFADAIGNTDTLTLGYDITATDTLDTAFGETNIISTPYTGGLDVRVGNVWLQQQIGYSSFGVVPFETKKQILPGICGGGNFWDVRPIAEINIITSHFPVVARWNKALFNDTCRNGSVFTSVHPGGWWDTGGFRTALEQNDVALFFNNQYYYISGADTVNVYWLAFSDSTLIETGIQNVSAGNSMAIFPNPATNHVSIGLNKAAGEIKTVAFYNTVGQLFLTTEQLENIDVSELPVGLYFVKVTDKQGMIWVNKLQKVN